MTEDADGSIWAATTSTEERPRLLRIQNLRIRKISPPHNYHSQTLLLLIRMVVSGWALQAVAWPGTEMGLMECRHGYESS
jgi:hypothetical protein